MQRLARGTCASILAGALTAPAVAAQPLTTPPIIGRWDLRVTGPDGTYPSWLEVSTSGYSTLVGRFVGGVGSARPIGRVDFKDGVLRFAIPPQWDQARDDLRVEGTLAGDSLAGTLVTPEGQRHSWTARRAPQLRRTAPVTWGAPVALFNGRDLGGWRAVGGENRWTVVAGVLTNAGGGANLVTTRPFGDFRLQLEFRYPKGSNSGVYLRGRYEVQIEDNPRVEPTPVHMGGVYGFLPPSERAAREPGEWQTYDISLVGRQVTVVLNGRTVIASQMIPGITGGALDSDEGAPGPIMLQGDHGPVEFRRIVVRTAR